MNTHFMIQPAAAKLVALTEGAIFVQQELWRDKQRNAFSAFWCIGQARENQVNNIFGQVMLTRRNPDFPAFNGVRTIGVWRCFGTH